jgi:hypothetical protein
VRSEKEHPELKKWQDLLEAVAVAEDLGIGFTGALIALRAAYGRLAGEPLAASAWTPLQGKALPSGEEENDGALVDRFEAEAPGILKVQDRALRLSQMIRLEPQRVRATVELAIAGSQFLGKVRAGLAMHAHSAGGTSAQSVEAALAELDNMVKVLEGDV